jgi:site-specific DNA-methyltransferase (adenine-specific)
MWERLNKLIKSNGAIVLFGSEPFSSYLRLSNIKNYKYDWIWEKSVGGGFLTANKSPLKRHENISIFSFGIIKYTPQKSKGKPYVSVRKSGGGVYSC